MLKAKIRLIAKSILCLPLLHHDYVFDPYSKVVVFVVTWFVGDDVADGEWYFGILNTGSDTDGALVDVEE